MQVEIRPGAVLTDEHSASSYGMPVLLVGGEAYGPRGILPGGGPAREMVVTWLVQSHPAGTTAEELEFARRFLGRRGRIVPGKQGSPVLGGVWTCRTEKSQVRATRRTG